MRNKKIIGATVIFSFLLSFSILSLVPSVLALPYQFSAQPSVTDASNDIIKIVQATQAVVATGQTRDGMDVIEIEISGHDIGLVLVGNVDDNATIYIMIDINNDDVGDYTVAYAHHTLGDKAVLYKGHYNANPGSEEYWNTTAGWSTGLGTSANVGGRNANFLNISIPLAAYTITGTDEFVSYIFDSTTDSTYSYLEYAPDYSGSTGTPPIPGFEIIFVVFSLSAVLGLYLWKKKQVEINTYSK